MAQRLTVLLTLWLGLSGIARGEALPDPTRPPLAAQEAGAAAGEAPGPRLQMIKISSTRRTAIVDGQEVTVGSKVGDARVVKIAEGEVVLRSKTGVETLKLFSDVEKRPVPSGEASGKTKKHGRAAKKKIDASSSRKAKE